MKTKTVMGLAVVVAMYGSVALADCPPGAVHCATSSDQQIGARGNLMHVHWPQMGVDIGFCMPYGGDLTLTNEQIIKRNVPMGRQDWEFTVCNDSVCLDSKPVGTDTFNLAKASQDHYAASPASYSLSFKDVYPSVDCAATTSQVGPFTIVK